MTLRTDERQWLIYGDEQIGAVIRGLEAWALMVLGTKLRNKGPNRNRPLNAIGALCQKIADQRLTEMKRNGGAQEVAADWILIVSKWASRSDALLTPDVSTALSEMQAVATYLDSRVNGAGILGPGVHRQAVRGD